MIMRIRQYGSRGEYIVTQSTSGFVTNYSVTSLQAHDALNDIIFLGLFGGGGALQRLSTPLLAVPIHPSESFTMEATLADGSTNKRRWVGSSDLDLALGHYHVEVYADTNDRNGTSFVAAYANQIGLVASGKMGTDGKPILDCLLSHASDI
jgi:hypothetical protein